MPETKFGKCQWCELERVLYFAIGSHGKEIWCGWICGACLDKARRLRDVPAD